MDQPGVADAAASVPVAAECAVPILSARPADGQLDFGQAYLGHPYRACFTLVNESRLPAKFEVLPQVGAGAVASRASARRAAWCSGSVPHRSVAEHQGLGLELNWRGRPISCCTNPFVQ
jgi:hydrocephalus-inducing protein